MQTNLCQTQLEVLCRLVSHLRPVIFLLADTGFSLDRISQTLAGSLLGLGLDFFFLSSDLKLKPQTILNPLSVVAVMFHVTCLPPPGRVDP